MEASPTFVHSSERSGMRVSLRNVRKVQLDLKAFFINFTHVYESSSPAASSAECLAKQNLFCICSSKKMYSLEKKVGLANCVIGIILLLVDFVVIVVCSNIIAKNCKSHVFLNALFD